MFAVLVLVAIFSSALPFEAAAQQNPPKCNDDTILKIYNYWRNNGGVPRRVIEHNIRCHQREIPFLSTQDFFVEGVTCAVVDHFARSHTIYYLKGNTVSYVHEAVTEEFRGQVYEPLGKNICYEIAEAGNAKLLHLCTLRSDAKEGPSQFVIKGVEGKTTKEDIKTMQDLLTTTFECNEPLRSYPDCSCSLLNEKPHPVEAHCPSKSCSHHH